MEKLETISTKMEGQSTLTAIYTDIWQRNVKGQREKKKQGNVTNAIKLNILQRIVGQNRRRRIGVFKKIQMKKVTTSRRILLKIWSRYSITNLYIY